MIFAFMRKSPFYEKALEGEGFGLYNGYVAFSDTLPDSYQNSWFYDDEQECLDFYVSPHGGITFDQTINPKIEMIPLTAIPSPEEWKGGIRCIGFDTAHLDDNSQKWDFEAVKRETMEMYDDVVRLIKKRNG